MAGKRHPVHRKLHRGCTKFAKATVFPFLSLFVSNLSFYLPTANRLRWMKTEVFRRVTDSTRMKVLDADTLASVSSIISLTIRSELLETISCELATEVPPGRVRMESRRLEDSQCLA